MKRTIAVILALVLVFALAVACGESPPPVAPTPETPPAPTPEPTPTPEPDPTPVPDPVDAGDDFNPNWKIAIVTNTVDQNEEEFRSAQAMQLKYGEDRVIHRTWPTNFGAEGELMISVLGNLAADPNVQAIIINQAVINTNAAIDRVRELRGDDVFIVVASPAENVEDVAVRADLILQPNDPLTGTLTADQALAMGADTIGFYSFERHLAVPTIALRRENMKIRAEQLGMTFVDLVAPDPLGDGGTPATQLHIMQDVPRQVAELGPNTAFFGTNCAMQAPMQLQVVETGAIYPIPCCPSPYHRFPETFGISDRVGTGVFVENPETGEEEEVTALRDIVSLVDEIKSVIADAGMTGRLATWPVPASMMWTHIGAEYAIKWILGEAPQDIGVIDLVLLNGLAEEYTETLYGERIGMSFEPFTFQGTTYNQWIMGAMDFLVF